MQFTVDSAFNSTYQLARANNYPNVRIFSVGTHAISGTPLTKLAQFDLPWSVASSKTVGGGNWTYMSAVCWFFGADLYDQYKVPVGLISTNWGGTYIQAWSSPPVLNQCKVTTPTFNQSAGPNQPSALYNAMIVPFLGQSIAGALWYQGEANVGNAPLYSCLFNAMIADWRSNFGNGYKFPFFFVQLAPWIDNGPGTAVADLRASQLTALTLPSVGFASAVDLGDPTSPFNNIHPRNKEEVSARLILAARNIAYGESSVVWQGPTFASATQVVSNQVATITVSFTTYGKIGLVYQIATCPTTEGVPENNCAGWEVQLNDGNWYTATSAANSGNTVVVTLHLSSTSSSVLGVRYAYSIWPLTSLYSAEGLPAIPFEYTFSTL
jgi:sialate O-acetylesterase